MRERERERERERGRDAKQIKPRKFSQIQSFSLSHTTRSKNTNFQNQLPSS